MTTLTSMTVAARVPTTPSRVRVDPATLASGAVDLPTPASGAVVPRDGGNVAPGQRGGSITHGPSRGAVCGVDIVDGGWELGFWFWGFLVFS